MNLSAHYEHLRSLSAAELRRDPHLLWWLFPIAM